MRGRPAHAALGVLALLAAGCGGAGPAATAGAPPQARPASPSTSAVATPTVAAARVVARRFARAVAEGDAGTACDLMTQPLTAWYRRRAEAVGLTGACRSILEIAARQRETGTRVVRVGPFKAEDGYMGALVMVSAPADTLPNATRAVALWLTAQGGRTLVARDGGLASVVDGNNATPWEQWPPADEHAAGADWAAPRPSTDCTPETQRRDTPQPVAHLGGPAVKAPWLDIRSVAVAGSGAHRCLRIDLGAPVRADTTIWVERISGEGTQGVLGELSLGPEGRYDYFGLRPHPQPFAEDGTTLVLYPEQPDLADHLSRLKVCVSSTAPDEPLFGDPVFVGDAYPAHDAPCGLGPVP